MKLIYSNVEKIDQEEGLKGIKKQIELAGRTCYKSEDKITDNSCEEFVQRMINSGHTSMLEHGTVYLTVPVKDNGDVFFKYITNPYSKVAYSSVDDDEQEAYVTTNYRVIVENGWEKDLAFLTNPVVGKHAIRFTFRFICDRGVSHEIVRHRHMSFAQESTRYCDYTSDKFNYSTTYIIPTWLEEKLPEGQYENWDGDWCDLEKWKIQHTCDNSVEDSFLYSLYESDTYYNYFRNMGWKPQQARQILPNALKTEIVVTGFVDDWLNFIKLRGAKNAHPDIQKLALSVAEQIINNVNKTEEK